MTLQDILEELKSYSNESIKKVHLKHGAQEPLYGVKVEDLKKIKKKIKKDYPVALELFDTGISDAMYLAGLIVDDSKMSKENLRNWAEKANWYMISEYTVPWVAAESQYGHEMALEWMQSTKETIASTGWATYSNLVALIPDEKLDLNEIIGLLEKITHEIHNAPNRVKQAMNQFVIAVGCYVQHLTPLAIETGKKIGRIVVDMGDTACKTPYIPDYIEKVNQRNAIGKKKKTVKC